MPDRRRRSIELDPIDLDVDVDATDAEDPERGDISRGFGQPITHSHYDVLDANASTSLADGNFVQIADDDDGAGSGIIDGTTGTEAGAPEGEHRIIFINRPQPTKYCNNRISTGKYNVFSFIPMFLFEQFRRWANIFFLFIALMQQIPDVSPTGRYTTLVPLIFILSVSAIKEIIEDIKRHRADDETNHREVEVLRDGALKRIRWLNVVVGDIVKVQNNNFFPADLIQLASSEPQAMSFIETANLDGETNLKIRQGLTSTSRLIDSHELKGFGGTLECEAPNRHLYEFSGVLKETDKLAQPLGPDQVLLRGAMLRNTSWIFGIVIYTGHETKLMKNSTSAPLKRSTVDKLTNTQVLMLFGILIFMCVISAVCNEIWMNQHSDTDWYIGLKNIAYQNIAYNFLTFIILFNNLIPISLQVTLEVVRFVQAIFINMDAQMYHGETDTPAMARTSNLNEELGQVKYVFSDKTGTLTRNIMEFKKIAVGSEIYSVAETPQESLVVQHIQNRHSNAAILNELMILLSVCHTVIPERLPDGTINYHAASPDERALVHGGCKFGYVFETRTPDSVEINALGVMQRYEILNVLEFTSTRKRMSVIVRDPQRRIKLFCKGADTVIYERLAPSGRQYSDHLLLQLEHFATEGLRTLCCAVADISPVAYDKWRAQYHEASIALEQRDRKLEEVAERIEKDLRLLGATAIEDKLQEGVPETIEALLRADIHVWVLTGDKQETAINIGYSCKLIVHGMPLILINEDSLDNTRESILRHSSELAEQLSHANNDIGLVVDGKTLKYALSHELQKDFIELCVACKVVICCRVSPMQKAEVVELVTRHTRAVTLAIGDGANDVAMIQKAHVGVGISGVEGLQAACASDYSIAQFRFLLRLLLVHGAWNYSRLCKLILYSFYKNICLYVIELWFAIYSGWSGQILFERWTIGLYNVMFTAWPPLAMGLFDRACSAETMLKYPKLYKPSQEAKLFNVKVFWVWIFNALLHSIILYWLTLYVCEKDVLWGHGRGGGYLVTGNFVYTYVVVAVCFKAGLVINSWTFLTHCAIWGSIVMWFAFILIYSNIYPHINVGAVFLGMDIMLGTCPLFWLGLFIIPLATVIPDVVFLVIRNTIFKSLTDWVREIEIRKDDPSEVLNKDHKHSLSETARLLKNVRSVFTRRSQSRYDTDVEMSHGFAFSQEEGATVTQTDIIRAYDTTQPKPDGN